MKRRPAYWPPDVDSELEMMLVTRLERAGLPTGVGQHPVVTGRQFRFDRAWPEHMVAVEVMGGVWIKSGHTTGSGIERDCLKASMAAALGWRCLPVTRSMIEDGTAIELISQALTPASTGQEAE